MVLDCFQSSTNSSEVTSSAPGILSTAGGVPSRLQLQGWAKASEVALQAECGLRLPHAARATNYVTLVALAIPSHKTESFDLSSIPMVYAYFVFYFPGNYI
jgi:hypothetical protein